MKNSTVREITSHLPRVLLVLASLVVAIPVQADATLYSYTSSPYTLSSEAMAGLPSQPVSIADRLIVRFSVEGALPLYIPGTWPENYEIDTDFTIESGTVSWSSSAPNVGMHELRVASLDGLTPLHWSIMIGGTDPAPQGTSYSMTFSSNTFSYLTMGWTMTYADVFHVDGTECLGSLFLYTDKLLRGTWDVEAAPVPGPATVLLLGSGLIPLAWSLRKKRWRK
jgi:hypothetical protein